MTARDIRQVEGIAGSQAFEDGEHVLVGFNVAGVTQPLDLMMATDRAVDAIIHLSFAIGDAERKRRADDSLIYKFQAVKWSASPDPDGTSLTMSYTLPGGAALHIQIDRANAVSFLESLSSMLGVGPEVSVPPGLKH